MTPTVMTGKNDCDCLVGGTAASDLSTFFSAMWLEQTGETLPAALPSSTPLPCEQNIVWHDTSAPFATGSSRPSILGDDPILAASVALIDSATEEVCLCYGFSGLMAPLVYALSRASARGVRVRVLLNSHFSCDLRPPMRDLAAGARALLLAAPTAEVCHHFLLNSRFSCDLRPPMRDLAAGARALLLAAPSAEAHPPASLHAWMACRETMCMCPCPARPPPRRRNR
ncbi:hypothetical protein T484DRAFT_1901734 [Baffinella frigidus]|nr:hypothetical protein T484DRAFT_1901734 [Cryptophyta sp. CCMP2293]